ncbi:hypothetical protein A2865_02465 [Candidatus Woesebacteria bacterium RIFCSPHIGHO2_01_FULL_39_17]|uniref:Uncharacterized protein n=3 Tax=Candidatus Woeseibacteriota TaxID=1752722 RepID=A0A0G0NKT5_9BACT|nr:MAG: hypothetical protein US72_C0004G0002 [Microgenomates group bacterium GW2011_GWC1_38_12]KKQ93697.1 MAG: hypothetical protein UT19_C0008G0022 [Candidatus Woesebacteria bacterium GW2011_GWB1_39_10b]KKR13441.1 MAG: hypothetical protein UT40_C0017G0027 [Candidatus Woesebacteria bacterium GW2011_GWA1_39_21b]OGM24112.1 MAG: hypothetical protein A2865_02465 [Candidatus Woesebacteria bacterium RIFCSPHIGHO2_01_FULL_39_17]OGM62886.1 MAG: hypothetical protein A3A52_03675 [Candidatus Woesebacteria b
MKLAQVPIETVCDPPESSFNCVATVGGFEGLFENAIAALLGLAGIALFIMLLVGGFKFITSGGDPKSLESAKNTLTHAIGGIVLVALSYLILRFIGVFTGADVVNFNIN